MSLKIGIVGLPNVGKSTLFQALTQKQVDTSNYPFATIEPNIGVVSVADMRLVALSQLSQSERTIPAIIEFVDIAGLVKGASEGEGLGNQFLSHIREVDAIAEVVRTFEDTNITHVEGSIDPERDRGIIETEFLMADLSTVEKALSRAEKDAKSGTAQTKKDLENMQALAACIKNGTRIPPELVPIGKSISLLSVKPILYIYNVKDDTQAPNKGLWLNIKLEEELSRMTTDEQQELGIVSRIPLLAQDAYKLLGLESYFTTGKDETRAWTIPAGSTVKRAGRAIHSDFEDKFIRAEVVFWEDLVRAGSYARAQEQNLVHTEGKEYIVTDGDVIEFKI